MTRLFIVLFSLVVAGCELPQRESKVNLPAPDSEGAQIMKKHCAACHAPPSPLVHTAKEWPNVVYRMQERRRMKAYELISEPEKTLLLEYLQKFSKS